VNRQLRKYEDKAPNEKLIGLANIESRNPVATNAKYVEKSIPKLTIPTAPNRAGRLFNRFETQSIDRRNETSALAPHLLVNVLPVVR
jgi:hypothetical protein